jgi:cell division cycle 20-like protein 1 (cofactor of APC complex)
MLASGGNDNMLHVWCPAVNTASAHGHNNNNSGGSTSTSEPLFSFSDHVAAVKAVAWSPHQHGLVASGGGTADRHIRFVEVACVGSFWSLNVGLC